jgi:hypothetical protein
MILTLDIPFSVLETAIRQMVVQALRGEGTGPAEGLSFVKLRVGGSVKVSREGDRVKVLIPVRATGQGLAGWTPNPRQWMSGKLGARPEFDLKVAGFADWLLDPQWRWPANLNLDTHQFTGNIQTVTSLLGPWVDARLDTLAAELNTRLKSLEIPRPVMLAAWEALASPVLINEHPPVWLLVRPQPSPLAIQTRVADSGLQLLISGKLRLRVGMGSPPQEEQSAAPDALPGEALDPRPADVQAGVQYDALAGWVASQGWVPFGKQINRTWGGLSFSFVNNQTVSWRISLSKHQSAPWVFTGQIRWDSPTNTLFPKMVVTGLTVVQGPAWVRLAVKVGKNRLLYRVESALNEVIRSYLDSVIAELHTQLASLPIGAGLTLRCAGIGLSPIHLLATAEGWLASVKLEGEPVLTVEKLEL